MTDPAMRPPLPSPDETARRTWTTGQKLRMGVVAAAWTLFVLWDYKIAFTVLNFAVCAFYAAVVGTRLAAVGLAWRRNPARIVSPDDLAGLADADLPVYTVLVPLYREAAVVPGLLDGLAKLDYPKDKLDVKILVEADDRETRDALLAARPPSWCEVLVVPDGQPRTKPRACNHGLAAAHGAYLVIFDAEDRPEPDQLKKAVAAFQHEPTEAVCLQAKLNYYNPDQSILTRFFTLEYTAWFDLFLPGLYRLGFLIPLGGTSNHFRTDALRRLGGWDAWNVTEDCDLGVSLARAGLHTAMLESTTWEEATARPGNWLRQRSRWVKGYWQTHFVHTRRWTKTGRDLGWRGTAGFVLTVGGQALTLCLNPFYALLMAAWVWWQWPLAYFDFTNADELAYTGWSKLSWTFCGIGTLLFAANFALIGINLLACARRSLWRLWPYALLSPLYWLFMGLGAWKGAWQLLWRPSYWEKTVHGQDQSPVQSPNLTNTGP